MQRALVLVAMPLLLLAGCSDSAPPSDQPDPTPQLPVGNLTLELQVPTILPAVDLGEGAGEPNIAVAPDGTLYITPIDHVHRSTDGGKTWTDLGTDKTDGHGDGDIVVTGNGRLHWLGLFGDAGPIPYQSSDDRGDTWTSPIDLSDDTGNDREWLAGRPEGILHASWRGGEGIETVTSFDDGATWGERVKMSDDAVGGPIVVGPKPGSVYEAMTTFAATPASMDAGILLARSHDNASSWETVPVFVPSQSAMVGLIGFPTSIFPVVAVDDNGTLYVVFAADQRTVPAAVPKPAARFGVYLTVSQDDGDTWSPPRLISDPEKAAVMPFVAAGAEGRIAVVWYENRLGVPHDTLPDIWDVVLWESIDADEADPASVRVILNTDPAHIGPVCTSGTGCLAGDRSLLDFFEVAIDNAGQPVVAWASSAAGTGIGVAAQPTHAWFGGAVGTPLR